MSLNEINRKLESILREIQRIRTEEELNSTLDSVEKLRKIAQKPKDAIAIKNKSQDVRTFENFTAVYKAAKMRADTLRDAGRMSKEITDKDSVEKRVMRQYATFQSKIEPKKLALLEEFKDRYTEAELTRVKQEDIETYSSRIEQNEREMTEANGFLKAISKDEIARYSKNDNIIRAIDQLNSARAEIQAAEAALAPLISPDDDAEIENQNNKIANAKAKIASAQKILNACEIVEAPQLIDKRGNYQSNIIDEITDKYRDIALQERKQAGMYLRHNLEKQYDNSSTSLQALSRMKMYIGCDIPADFSRISEAKLQSIVKSLTAVATNIDRQSTENHKLMSKIDEINKFLELQKKEQDVIAGKGKIDSSGNAKYGFKTPRQYREEGVTLDETYKLKGFWERKAAKQDFILSTLPPDAPFRRLRAFFRSFSSRAGYALSAAEKPIETQYRRKEEAFKAAYKVMTDKGLSTADARVEGMKQVRTDKLSGKKKAQMEDRVP